MWFNESRTGIFAGPFSSKERDPHFSYHQDGKSHFKINGKPLYEKKLPKINDVVNWWPIISCNIPISVISSDGDFSKYEEDIDILLTSDEFEGFNYLKIDLYLIKTTEMDNFLSGIIDKRQDDNIEVIKKHTYNMNNFPNHECLLLISSQAL